MNIDLLCGHSTMLDAGCTRCAFVRGTEEYRKRAVKYLRDTADYVRGDYNAPDLLRRMAMEIQSVPLQGEAKGDGER